MHGTIQFLPQDFIDHLVPFYCGKVRKFIRYQGQLEMGFRSWAGVHMTFVDKIQMPRVAGILNFFPDPVGDFHDDSWRNICDNARIQ